MIYRSVAIFITLLSAGCDMSAQGYLPSDDPLVLVRFESMLSDAGIQYRQDEDGFYAPLDASDYERLTDIGETALDIEAARTSVVIQSKCGGDGFRDQLRKRKVYFVEQFVNGEPVVTVSRSDAEKISINALYASSELNCR